MDTNSLKTLSIVISEGTLVSYLSLPLAFSPRHCSKKRFRDLKQETRQLENRLVFEESSGWFTDS
jgi:hypothetical protein